MIGADGGRIGDSLKNTSDLFKGGCNAQPGESGALVWDLLIYNA